MPGDTGYGNPSMTGAVGKMPIGGPGGTLDPSWLPRPFPVGGVFIAVVNTNPATLLGYGTWTSIGAGRVLVGFDGADPNFDAAEEMGGSKTVAATGTVAAPALSGSTAAEAAHTHGVTPNVAVANHAAGTTGAHSGVAQKIGTSTASAAPSPHTHSTPALVHSVTNNPVTSGAGSSHLHGAGTLAASAPAFTGTPSSVVQPYLVCWFWKRTA